MEPPKSQSDERVAQRRERDEGRLPKPRSKRRPRKCPDCGSSRVVKILYGLQPDTEKIWDDLKAGRVVLGGCCISGDDPRWECLDCGEQVWEEETVL